MNIKFKNIKNKTVVYDEQENFEEREYQDNIEEVLVIENEIETAEKKQRILLNKIRKAKKRIEKAKKAQTAMIVGEVMGIILAGIASIFEVVNPISNFIVVLVWWNCVTISTAYVYGLINILKKGKISRENINGYKFQYVFLKRYIHTKKSKLEVLKKNKTSNKTNENDYVLQKVKDKNQLLHLRNFLEICHILGVKYKQNQELSLRNIQLDKSLYGYKKEDIEHCIDMTLNRKQ